MRLPKLGTVWTASAIVRMIDMETGRWVNLARCIDTPNAIARAVCAAKKKHPGKVMFIKSDVDGNYPAE